MIIIHVIVAGLVEAIIGVPVIQLDAWAEILVKLKRIIGTNSAKAGNLGYI